jgi:cation:H+ antiporter
MNSLFSLLAVFASSLVLISVSSYILTANLERIGGRLGFSEGLLGIVTALGADAPEIASAITALMAGHNELGVGVVIGSNIFNLAAVLGLSAVVAGVIRPGREGLFFDGGVAVLVTLIGAALMMGFIAPWLSAVLLGALLVPYVWLSSLYPTHIERMKRLPLHVRQFLGRALAEVRDSKLDVTPQKASLFDVLVIVPVLFAIVAGSQSLVHATVALAERFSLPHAAVGMLVIAALTGIPNAIAASRLALRGRGAAVVTESFNSNTINIVAGICLPALIVGLGHISPRTVFALWWLGGMTVAAIALTAWGGGLRRIGGAILLLLYAGFVVVTMLWR